MERVCTKCNNILPSNEFYKGAQWCIKCRKVYNIENKLKIQAYYQQKDTSEIQKRFYYKNTRPLSIQENRSRPKKIKI